MTAIRTTVLDLEPGETLVRIARKHWIIFAGDLLPYVILFIIPLIVPALLRLSPITAPFAASLGASRVARLVLGIWLLVVWTAAVSSFTRYFLNAWVVTDRRIIDIKQRSYFNREISSVMLDRVQDVTTDVSGVLHSLIGIGTIRVQSAGTEDEFRMYGIGHPDGMRDTILRYVPQRSADESV